MAAAIHFHFVLLLMLLMLLSLRNRRTFINASIRSTVFFFILLTHTPCLFFTCKIYSPFEWFKILQQEKKKYNDAQITWHCQKNKFSVRWHLLTVAARPFLHSKSNRTFLKNKTNRNQTTSTHRAKKDSVLFLFTMCLFFSLAHSLAKKMR